MLFAVGYIISSVLYSIFNRNPLYQRTEKLYTGPSARRMVSNYYKGQKELDLDTWKAFVLCKEFKDSLELKPGADVLEYQA